MSRISRLAPGRLVQRAAARLDFAGTGWWKAALVLGVLGLSAVVIPLLVTKRMTYALAFLGLVAALPALAVFWRKPQIALVILAAAGLVIPFSIGTGSESRLNANILLALAITGYVVVEAAIHKLVMPLRWVRPFTPAALFIVVSAVSFSMGQLPWYYVPAAPVRAQLGGFALNVVAMTCLFSAAYIFAQDIRWLRITCWVFIGFGTLPLLPELFPPLNALVISSGTGSLFWLWFVAITTSQAFFNRSLPAAARVLFGALAAGAFFIRLVLYNDWTSGWLPALVTLFVVLVAGSRWIRIPLVLAALGVGVFKFSSISEFLTGGTNTYSLVTRLEAWKILWQIIMQNPLFGVGFANYYWYTQLYPILGYFVKFNSHNNYVDLVAQTGLLGLGVFIWLFGEMAWAGISILRKVEAGFERAFVIGAIGGIAGTLVAAMLGDWVLPFVYNIGYNGFRASVLGWLFLGGMLALQQVVMTREKKEQGESGA